jgi:hypothetical protein
MYLKRISRLAHRVEEKDPDIYKIPDCQYLSAYRRWRKKEPNKRFVLKISRSVMWYINIVGIKL